MRKGLTLLMVIGMSSAQETPLSEIFFLDLGIVIEPTNGSETYSRVVNKPSKEVAFKIKKIESGSVYMASSEELLSTLDRINNRIEKLENSFQSEMGALWQENVALRQTLASLQSTTSSKKSYGEVNEEKPEVDSPPKPIEAKPAPTFDQSAYMAGVFAYQREDFKTAIQKFSTLALASASKKTGENVLYWMADAYQQLGNYEKALSLLDQITISGTLRNDDALVKKGLLHRKMGNEPLAQLAFSHVVSQHPESEYYRLAQMELKKSDGMK
jgi:TolA-binding protein